MPYKEKEIEKKYWSIGEVTEQLGFKATSQLRFYEMEKVMRKRPKKSRKGTRKYDRHDIEILTKIQKAWESKQFTMKGITTVAYQPEKLLALIFEMHPELKQTFQKQ